MIIVASAVVLGWLSTASTPEASAPPPPAPEISPEKAPEKAPEAAGKPRPLQAALTTANTTIRRGKEGLGTPESVVLSDLAGELVCEVTVAETSTSESGKTIGRSALVINRLVSVQSKLSDEQIRVASSRIAAARAEGDRALREFENAWEPMRSDGTKYIRTHWGGCRKHWPRISTTEYQNRRNTIIEKNLAAVGDAQENLASTRESIRVQQNRIIQAAKTVNLVFTADKDLATLDELREGKRIKLVLRVEKVELGSDPESVRNPSSYVSTVHGSVVSLASAR